MLKEFYFIVIHCFLKFLKYLYMKTWFSKKKKRINVAIANRVLVSGTDHLTAICMYIQFPNCRIIIIYIYLFLWGSSPIHGTNRKRDKQGKTTENSRS